MTLYRRRRSVGAAIVCAVLGSMVFWSGARASTLTIWTNTANYGPSLLRRWDLNGNLLQSITAPHGYTGRGIQVIGNIVYYTSRGSNAVYGYNYITNTDLGTMFTVANASGLASIAFDGSTFYIEDYSGSNVVFKYSLGGIPLGVTPLANCPASASTCDGLEYANGRLISNRGDGFGPYDVYNGNGGPVVTPAFIVDPGGYNTTGIAFDGTYYYTSRVGTGQIVVYNISGVYQHTITLIGGSSVEDISVGCTPKNQRRKETCSGR